MTEVNFSPGAVADHRANARKTGSAGSAASFGSFVQSRLVQGRVLGIAFIWDEGVKAGVRASYAESSTARNPVIRVAVQRSNGTEEVHDVEIKKIDTYCATALEMFALCQYADDIGLGAGGSFGSWELLKRYSESAARSGYIPDAGIYYDSFANKRQNWDEAVMRMMKDYADSGDRQSALAGGLLLAMFKEAGGQEDQDEIDWRNMSNKSWNQFLEDFDKYIESYKERIKLLRKAQLKAAQEAARRAPAAYKAMAAQAAAANVALLSAVSGTAGVNIETAAAAGISKAIAAEEAVNEQKEDAKEADSRQINAKAENSKNWR